MTDSTAVATAVPVSAPVVAPVSNPDDLGVDRAFVLQMAQVPFIALGFVFAAYLSHVIWDAIAGPGATMRNYGPVIVVSIGMVVAAIIDGWAFKVPNWLTLSLVLSGWIVGLLHTCGVAIDAGTGGVLSALLCTLIGFALLFPLLAIVGMGQGDVKMLMGFGAWVGAFFGGQDAVSILVWAFCLGAVIGGCFGLIMMVVRRKFGKNLSNFKEIFTDLQVMVAMGPTAAAERASSRRKHWDRLPYGIPLCVGFLGYLGYLFYTGQLS